MNWSDHLHHVICTLCVFLLHFNVYVPENPQLVSLRPLLEVTEHTKAKVVQGVAMRPGT